MTRGGAARVAENGSHPRPLSARTPTEAPRLLRDLVDLPRLDAHSERLESGGDSAERLGSETGVLLRIEDEDGDPPPTFAIDAAVEVLDAWELLEGGGERLTGARQVVRRGSRVELAAGDTHVRHRWPPFPVTRERPRLGLFQMLYPPGAQW